ncbi:MAG: magnesium transporter [Fidelibacterota bacterium]
MLDKEVQVLLEYFRKLLRRRAWKHLNNLIAKTHPADIAFLFRYFNNIERREVFNFVKDPKIASELLRELDKSILLDLVENIDKKRLVEIFKEMPKDDKADILGNLPDELSDEIFLMLKEEESKELEQLMKYDIDTAGGIMTPEYLALNENMTAEEAVKSLQESEESEMVFYLYVTDNRNHLVGVLSLRHLLTVSPKTRLKDIMITDVVSVHPEVDQEEVARIVSRYNILAIPVVDHENKIIGIVTVDDIIDVIREEATEDFLKMAGVGREREILLKSTFGEAKLRFPWLFATSIGGIIASIIVGMYRELLSQIVLLAAFMPIIAGMGGNVGSQSSTIVVRGLATGRVNVRQVWKILFREVFVGILLGLIFGVLIGIAASFFFQSGYILGVVVGLGICLVMIVATAMGTFAPMLLNRLNIDPAIASSPFVTTSIDIIGILIYFLIATAFLLR